MHKIFSKHKKKKKKKKRERGKRKGVMIRKMNHLIKIETKKGMEQTQIVNEERGGRDDKEAKGNESLPNITSGDK